MKCLNRFGVARLAVTIALAISCSGVIWNKSAAAAESAAASATSELELLPDETLVAVVVPQLNLLDAKITALGQPLHAPLPPLLMMGKGMLGLHDGLKDDGAVVLAMIGPATDENKVGTPLVIIGVTDYQKFIGQFSPQEDQGIAAVTIHGQKMYAAKAKNDLAVLVKADDASRKLLERVVSGPSSTIKSNLALLKDWLLKQDLALFGSEAGVALFLQHIDQHLNEAQQQQQTTDSVRELEHSISGLIPSVQKEIAQIGLGVRIDDDHTIHLLGRAVLAGDGELTKAAAESTEPKDVSLAGLPSIPYLFAMDGTVAVKLKDWITRFSINSLKAKAAQSGAKINDEDWKKLADAMNNTMRGSKATSYVMGIPQPGGKSVYSQMYGLIRVDDAQQYLRDYETNMSQYAAILKSINIPTLPVCDLNKIEMGEVPVLEMTMDMSGALKDMQKQGAPQAAAFTQMLMGGGRSTVHLAAAGPNAVVMAWGELENLKTVLESAKSPADSSLATDTGVKTTAAMLPKGAQWRGFLNPAGYLEFIQNVLQMTMPQMPFHLPPFPTTAAVGFAAQLSPENLDVEMIVPGSVLEGAGAFTQQLRNPAMR
jgi:hypothetical protein